MSDTSPLQTNPQTGEPYLRLLPPFQNMIITPPRTSDAPALVEVLSDPRVYKDLQSPPFPYHLSDAESWLALITKEAEEGLQALKEAYDASSSSDGQFPYVSVWPFRYIREIMEDGSDTLVGEISICRCRYVDVQDPEERARLVKASVDLRPGDPNIIWCFGDWAVPSYHGRGIMTAAIKTVIHEWMIPRMGARQIRVEAYIENPASVRVFEKNGFVLEDTVAHEVVTNSGEKKSGFHVLRWRHPQAK